MSSSIFIFALLGARVKPKQAPISTGWGKCVEGVPLRSRLGVWASSWTPQQGPRPGRKRIFNIF